MNAGSVTGRALSAIAEAEQDLGKRFVEFRGLVMEKTVKPLEDSLQNELKEAEVCAPSPAPPSPAPPLQRCGVVNPCSHCRRCV
jgi:hypothetical protein